MIGRGDQQRTGSNSIVVRFLVIGQFLLHTYLFQQASWSHIETMIKKMLETNVMGIQGGSQFDV